MELFGSLKAAPSGDVRTLGHGLSLGRHVVDVFSSRSLGEVVLRENATRGGERKRVFRYGEEEKLVSR
jgi:hypothetical protein